MVRVERRIFPNSTTIHWRDQSNKYDLECDAWTSHGRLWEYRRKTRPIRFVDWIHTIHHIGRKTSRWLCMVWEAVHKEANDIQVPLLVARDLERHVKSSATKRKTKVGYWKTEAWQCWKVARYLLHCSSRCGVIINLTFLLWSLVPPQNNRDFAKDPEFRNNEHDDFLVWNDFWYIFCLKQRMEGYERREKERRRSGLRCGVLSCAVLSCAVLNTYVNMFLKMLFEACDLPQWFHFFFAHKEWRRHVHVHRHFHVHIHVRIHIHVHVHIHTHVRARLCVCVSLCLLCCVCCCCVTDVQIVHWTRRKARISQLLPSRAGVEQLLSGKADDWRTRERVVLDLFSNLKMGKVQGFFRWTSGAKW